MSTFFYKNLRRLFDKYAVACTEHDTLVKTTTKILSNFVAFSENLNFTLIYGTFHRQIKLLSVCRSIYSHICQPHILYIFINFNFLGSMQYINKAEQATALAANMSQQIWAWTHPSQQCHQSFLTKNGSRMMFSSFCTTVLCIFLTQWGEIIFNELKNYSYVTVRHCCTFLARAQYFKGQFYRKR